MIRSRVRVGTELIVLPLAHGVDCGSFYNIGWRWFRKRQAIPPGARYVDPVVEMTIQFSSIFKFSNYDSVPPCQALRLASHRSFVDVREGNMHRPCYSRP